MSKTDRRKRKKTAQELEIEEWDRKVCDAVDAIPPFLRVRNKHLIDRVLDSGMHRKYKIECLKKLQTIECDKAKQIEWLENILRVPFGKFSELPVTKKNSPESIADFFDKAEASLDSAVHGMATVKEEVVNYIAQIVSTDGSSIPRVIALCGSPGIGKTAIVRRGLAAALNRPMKCISMGGISDSSYFFGFDYTYQGSKYGAIVQALIETGVMNPVIFMDELDKISGTQDGIEVQNLLVHLTDPVQNSTFTDKYFAGIDIDISKVLFVFSYNDEKLVNPVLKDRLHIIRVPDPTTEEKVTIGSKYLVEELNSNAGFNKGDIIFSREVVKKIIDEFCKKDKGVRNLKRCIETIMLKCNTARYLGKRQKYKTIPQPLTLPLTVTEEMAKELLSSNKNDEDLEWMSRMFV